MLAVVNSGPFLSDAIMVQPSGGRIIAVAPGRGNRCLSPNTKDLFTVSLERRYNVPAMVKARQQATEWRRMWPILAACAVALALRVYHLSFQSLWWDEGISLYLAERSLAELTVNKDFSLDLHPPLFHVFLGVWVRLFGADVFSARLFPVFLGVLNVPLLYALGRRLAGHGVGVAAAWLVVISAVHVYYSQELRMYTLLPLLATLSLWFFIALLGALGRHERLVAGIGYVIATAVGIVLLLLHRPAGGGTVALRPSALAQV
jgi:predicted membrane-bound mannosyltransferase